MKAIFAVDPGKHTGVAWAIVDETADTVADALPKKKFSGSATVEGSEMEQARELFDLWEQFKVGAVRKHKIDPDDVELVIEAFTLIPGHHAGGKEGISPARIGWAFEAYRQGRGDKYRKRKHVTEAVWQEPGAMRNKKHLKKWDCWVVGREHERSAFCHLGERLRHLMR